MKALFLAAATVAGLGGCAVYPDAGYGSSGAYGAPVVQPYEVQQPVYIYGSTVYRGGYGQPRGYGGRRGQRDLDRDGVPNRYDRDRDGDGVPNRFDRTPNRGGGRHGAIAPPEATSRR
ncbi:MAG: hypothetical protein JWP47_2170 [Polaromonas sp.]|jgi:hypothetical protein|nr:hypothetical protein [Polaromonas sp.]